MVNNEVSFLFNTEHLYSPSLSVLGMNSHKNTLFESDDLIVYLKDNFEVMINDTGLVSITTRSMSNNYKKIINDILNEYKEIADNYNEFLLDNLFKVIVPKNELKNNLIKELNDLNYHCDISTTKDSYTIRVKTLMS